MASQKTQTIGILLILCLIGGCANVAINEGTPSNSIRANSVWQGTCDQIGIEPYPMIIFIQNRNGNAFEGITWYPTLDNGICLISGQVEPGGIVKFTEDSVIHGGVLSGSQYTATIKGKNLKGGYVYIQPDGKTDKGNIILKLAD